MKEGEEKEESGKDGGRKRREEEGDRWERVEGRREGGQGKQNSHQYHYLQCYSQSRRIDDVKIIFLDVTQLNEEVSVILYIIIVSNGYAELSLCL